MIYGIGLPRTGTTTLARALDILGYNGFNHCMLTSDDAEYSYITDETNEYIVDNSYYLHFKDIEDAVVNDPTAKFILTMRDQQEWYTSISKFNGAENFIPAYIYIYHWIVTRAIPEDRLLIVDWSAQTQGREWDTLCYFLGINPLYLKASGYPEFPCENC